MLTKEDSHGQAASFSFVCDVDRNGGDARLRARRGAREWAGKDAKHRIHPRPFRCLETSVLSLVRAAGIRPRPGNEQVALALHREPAAFSGGGSPGLPPSKDGQGVSDYDQLVGDYTNPILQPWAAEVVKKFGEISLAGITYPNPSNQCWPEPVPFIFKRVAMQMIQQADKITILYGEDHEVRWVRLNQPHPTPVTPSWHGDSVGHYDADSDEVARHSEMMSPGVPK